MLSWISRILRRMPRPPTILSIILEKYFSRKRRLKIRWLSLFLLVYWFFSLLAEMEEDDTYKCGEDDDEVRKNSETRIWLHQQYVILYCRTRSAFFFLTMWHLILFYSWDSSYSLLLIKLLGRNIDWRTAFDYSIVDGVLVVVADGRVAGGGWERSREEAASSHV